MALSSQTWSAITHFLGRGKPSRMAIRRKHLCPWAGVVSVCHKRCIGTTFRSCAWPQPCASGDGRIAWRSALYLYARQQLVSRSLAVLGVLITALIPKFYDESDAVSLDRAALFLIPFGLMCCDRALTKGGRSAVVWSAVLAFAVQTQTYYGIFRCSLLLDAADQGKGRNQKI